MALSWMTLLLNIILSDSRDTSLPEIIMLWPGVAPLNGPLR